MTRCRTIRDRSTTSIISVLLLVAAGCADPAYAPRPVALPPIDAKISSNVNLDQQDLTLQYVNTQGTVVSVTPPWGSAVSVHAEDNVRFDHFTSDGWVVVYNTFDLDRTNSRPVLVLYNKYRGLLRWWWWNDQDPAAASNYLSYALATDGDSTSLLNFTGEFARPYDVRSLHPFVVTTNSSTFNQGLLNQSWYYVDTEMAYDPRIAGKPQANYSLILNSWATSTATITLDGDVNGSITGTISGSGSNALIGTLIGQINTNVHNSTTTINNGQQANSSLSTKLNTAIGNGLSDAIKSSLTQLANQGLRVITSPLSNLFGSLVSAAPAPQQKVDLSLTARVTLHGDLSTQSPAMIWTGALPGTARGDLSGYLPYYNDPMGMFNLASAPVVKWKSVVGLYPPLPAGYKDIQFTPVTPTVIINPAIANEVTVSPVTASLIFIKTYSGSETFYSNQNIRASTALSNFPVVNNLFGNEWYGFSAPYAIRYNYWSGTPETNVVVKISFTVTPNNGSPPIDVIKIYRPVYVQG